MLNDLQQLVGENPELLLDMLQFVLMACGLVPGAGEVCDGADAVVSFSRGDYVGGILAGIAVIPVAGYLGTLGNVALKSDKLRNIKTIITKLLKGRTSVWSKNWAERGLAIEEKLGGNLPAGFPTIDRFENGVATSIKSTDLNASTYQSPSRLSGKLRGYVDKVAGFNGANHAGTRIDANQITSRQLDIAIPKGAKTADQAATLSQVIAYGQSKGVTVNMVEIS